MFKQIPGIWEREPATEKQKQWSRRITAAGMIVCGAAMLLDLIQRHLH